jgi:hypothetical protein
MPKKRGGQKRKITDQDREEIKKLAMHGMTIKDIASVKSISIATLKRRCMKEINSGRVFAKAVVQATAYDMAISGKHPAMTIFWLKTRCKWREKNRFELTGAKGKPLNPANTIPVMPADPIEAAKVYQKFMEQN